MLDKKKTTYKQSTCVISSQDVILPKFCKKKKCICVHSGHIAVKLASARQRSRNLKKSQKVISKIIITDNL